MGGLGEGQKVKQRRGRAFVWKLQNQGQKQGGAALRRRLENRGSPPCVKNVENLWGPALRRGLENTEGPAYVWHLETQRGKHAGQALRQGLDARGTGICAPTVDMIRCTALCHAV